MTCPVGSFALRRRSFSPNPFLLAAAAFPPPALRAGGTAECLTKKLKNGRFYRPFLLLIKMLSRAPEAQACEWQEILMGEIFPSFTP